MLQPLMLVYLRAVVLSVGTLCALSACSKSPSTELLPSAGVQLNGLIKPSAPAALPNAASQVQVACQDSTVITAGAYLAENNSWGKKGMVGWSQCMGAMVNPAGGISARWTWDWKNEGDHVKAYPEIIYGQKPGYPKSSNDKLPRLVQHIQQLDLIYDVEVEREGAGNMAIDMWLTSIPNPATFSAPPITHEVMIWLEAYGPMYAGGEQIDKVRINGTTYRVFKGDNFGLGWRYIAFAPNSPMKTQNQLDLKAFFDYLKTKQLMSGAEYLSAINFGNEIISGSGETKLHQLQVNLK